MNLLIFLLQVFPSFSTTFEFNQTTTQHFISLKNLSIAPSDLELNLMQLSPKTQESLLTARKSLDPVSQSNNSEFWSIKSDSSDLDSWISKSPNHSLQLAAFDNWKLGIFTYNLEAQIEWRLSIKPLSTCY